MNKTCAITGIQLTTAPYFSNYFTRSLHPLLEVNTKQLLELAASKGWMEWQEDEAKLLFLSLANSLGMLDVVTPAIATPTPRVIASSIEQLVAIAGWHSVRSFPLPTLRISEDLANSNMDDFPNLLSTIIASRAETDAGDKLALEAIRLEETIKILYAKCSIGANKHKMLRNTVANWALKITSEAAKQERVDKEVLDLWYTMLTTAPVDAWKFQRLDSGKANNDDLLELDEFMTCNLPHGCTASYEVMKHLTAMKNATTQLASFLGIDNVITVISAEDAAAIKPPVESDFSTKLDFLIAKAKFQQAVVGTSVAPATATVTSSPVVAAHATGAEELAEEGDSNEYGI